MSNKIPKPVKLHVHLTNKLLLDLRTLSLVKVKLSLLTQNLMNATFQRKL